MPATNKWSHIVVTSLLSGCICGPAQAFDPIWLPSATIASCSAQVSLSTTYDVDFSNQFGASSDNDSLSGAMSALVSPHPSTHLYLYLPTTSAAPGDATLGIRIDPLVAGAWRLGLGWQSIVPLSADRGTPDGDELSVVLLSHATWTHSDLRLDAQLGLAIRGDPLRPASQDDQPVTWLVGQRRMLSARVGGTWPTARNPARLQALGGLRHDLGRGWMIGAEAGAGLSPAAPTWTAGLWAGWRSRAR